MSAANDRWSKAVTALHWISAVLIVGLLTAGFLMTSLDPADPMRRIVGRMHSISGNLLGLLTLGRLVVRRRAPRPEPLSVPALHQKGITIVHGLLYAIPLASIATGLATGLRSTWHPYLTGELPRPPALESFVSRHVHEALAVSLAILVAAHVVGAIVNEIRHGKTLRRIMPFMR